MTHRQRLQAVIHGKVPDRTPVTCRLDLWHRARLQAHDLPGHLAGLTLAELQLQLGMAVSARAGRVFTMYYRGPVEYHQHRDGLMVYDTWNTPRGTLQWVRQYEAQGLALGMQPRTIKYPIEKSADYQLYEFIMAHVVYDQDHDEFSDYDRQIGDNGLPMVVLGASPAHDLMMRWVGYENAFFQIADDAAVFDSAVAAGRRAMEQMWPIVAQSPCQLVMHGVNFDSAMTSPPIFRQYMLEYLRDFNRVMHNAGKKVAFHGDGDMSALLALMIETEFDVADCLACAPLVRLPLVRACEAWRDKIVIWGGMPSPLLEPHVSDAAFRAHLETLLQITANRGGFIAGISDQAMPDALLDRLGSLGQAWSPQRGASLKP